MKIVWKDTVRATPKMYRGYEFTRYKNGWVINHPEDPNIYYSLECAYNALDQRLGGKGRNGSPKYRLDKGIVTIGIKVQ